MPRLGAPFLSSAYLRVDNDRKQFIFAKSSRGVAKERRDSKIVPVLPSTCVDTSAAPRKTSETAGSASGAKGVIGGVVGGVVGGLVVAGALVLLWRRRRRKALENESSTYDPFAYGGVVQEADSRALGEADL